VASIAGGCSGAGDATGGKRVELATRIDLSAAAQAPFTNGFGYEVTLDRVLVSVGELRYHAGAPVGWRRSPAGQWFGVREAWAHPGHYAAGDELGEMLDPDTVDLLSAPVGLTDGEGVTGEYLSAAFSFRAPPVGSLASELGDDVVLVQGSAKSADLEFAFEAHATEADVLDTYGVPVVAGCPFSDGTVASDGTVVVTIDPALWLDQVDFAREPNVVAGETTVLDPAGVPHEAFVRGLKKAAGYAFSFTASQEPAP
jgi:hypothetical protein